MIASVSARQAGNCASQSASIGIGGRLLTGLAIKAVRRCGQKSNF